MRRWALFLLALALAACARAPAPAVAPQAERAFHGPEPVRIEGYDGDAMEPFLSRDGSVLFFNNRNEPAERTDLHWAERIDDLHFRYRGLVKGANSPALDGVATVSADGRFCFVSTRSYFQSLATIHCGDWRDGRVENAALQPEVSAHTLGRVMFDAEIDPQGQYLIVADGTFRGRSAPVAADLRLARLGADDAFHLSPEDDGLFANLNTQALDYAAALSADGLELAFTRLSGAPLLARTEFLIARRPSVEAAFEPPQLIAAIDGFAEAPSFSPDGRALYYHKRVGERFEIWRVTR